MKTQIFAREAGQSTTEFAILIFVLAAALVATSVYIKRGLQGKLKMSAASLGDPYDPTNISARYIVTRFTNSVTTSDLLMEDVGNEHVTRATLSQETVLDRVRKQGQEAILAP